MVYQGDRKTFIADCLEGLEALYSCLEKNPMDTSKFYKTNCDRCKAEQIQEFGVRIRMFCFDCIEKNKQDDEKRHVDWLAFTEENRKKHGMSAFKPYFTEESSKRYYKAQYLVQQAVKKGILKKPSLCEGCGLESKRTLNGHHDDYLKTLEVRWLCGSCHNKWHAKNGHGLNR